MNRDGLQQILEEANAIAAAGENGSRPWHIVLVLAIGAWLSALPLLLPFFLALNGLDAGHAANAGIGVLTIAAAVACLRRRQLPILLEQAAFPVLLSGGTVLAYSLYHLVEGRFAFFLMAATAAVVAAALPQSWLRSIFGAACAALLVPALLEPKASLGDRNLQLWLALHFIAATWLGARLAARNPRWGVALDPFLAGWLAFTLSAFAYWAGPAMLGPPLDFGPAGLAVRELQPLTCGISAACTIAAMAILVRALPAVRQWWCLGIALTIAAFTCFLPAIGIVFLLLAICVADGRYRLAAACGIAAAWITSSAYYDLSLPLAHKAALFALAGALLLAFCLVPLRRRVRLAQAVAMPQEAHIGLVHAGLAVSGLAALAIANTVVVRNEGLIASGQVVYVALAPRDPRSLMQGDYMQLAVSLPRDEQPGEAYDTVYAIGQLGPDKVLRLERYQHDGKAPGNGEVLVKLERDGWRWKLATDAWFFKEGAARKYEKARYGEYRVAPSGRALLVGLRGPGLEPL